MVPASNVVNLNFDSNTIPNSDVPPNALALFFGSDTLADSITVQVWSLDVGSAPELITLTTPGPFKPRLGQRWGLLSPIGADPIIASNVVSVIPNVPCEAPLYIRILAAAVVGPPTTVLLKGACVVV